MSIDPVNEFERRFAKLIGSEYCIAVNSGTSALHAALEAIDVRHGEVIMPALCPAMDAMAIIHAGAWPVFADVDPETQLVTYETIKPLIGPRTKGIIAVALHGLPTDIDDLSKAGLPIIEDCAQSLLAPYKDGYAGTKATIGCYSFERKKHLTTGSEGGAIVTNDAKLAERARKFAGLGYSHMTAESGRTSLSGPEFQYPSYQRFDTIGLNYRMSWAQAEVGLHALKTVKDDIWRRQEIGWMWREAMKPYIVQHHTYSAENVFYSVAYPWDGPWQNLYSAFTERGGDGFYAMPRMPFEEPALLDYKPLLPTCTASGLQKRLCLFKTHYKDLTYAKKQADILSSLLR